jgi:hypothetical protein
MAPNSYYQVILDTLQGWTDQLRTIPSERLDWSGQGALLDLYRKTSGNDRGALIRAIGRVIQDHPAPPAVMAQLIQIASSLDLAEVEPQVRKLQEEAIAAQEPLRGAVVNYLAFRQLAASPKTAKPPRAANDKPVARNARPARAVKRQTGTV